MPEEEEACCAVGAGVGATVGIGVMRKVGSGVGTGVGTGVGEGVGVGAGVTVGVGVGMGVTVGAAVTDRTAAFVEYVRPSFRLTKFAVNDQPSMSFVIRSTLICASVGSSSTTSTIPYSLRWAAFTSAPFLSLTVHVTLLALSALAVKYVVVPSCFRSPEGDLVIRNTPAVGSGVGRPRSG